MMTSAAINKGIISKSYTIEDFFWSPDMPLIPVKQAHMIKRRFESDNAYYVKYMTTGKEIHNFNKQNSLKPVVSPAIVRERMFCEVIYPNWNPNIYAASKGSSKNPELKLFEIAIGNHHAELFLEELRESKLNKFSMLNKKSQFYRWLTSKQYFIGKVNIQNV
jgi:hypothetical protein